MIPVQLSQGAVRPVERKEALDTRKLQFKAVKKGRRLGLRNPAKRDLGARAKGLASEFRVDTTRNATE